MGSDESHFNISLIVRDKVTRQCPKTTTFEEKGEPKQIRTEVPLLTSLTRHAARPNRLKNVHRADRLACICCVLYPLLDIHGYALWVHQADEAEWIFLL